MKTAKRIPITKKAIAEHLGISRTAVSLVLNNSENSTISEETKESILKAADELGYKNEIYSKKICYVLCDREITDPRYMLSLKSVEEYASGQGYNMMFMSIKPTIDEISKLRNLLRSDEVEGYILNGNISETIINEMNETKVPFVAYGMSEMDDIEIIVIDMEKVLYEATKYLIDLGHKEIALLLGSLNLAVHQSGYRGYSRALEENGITLDKSMIQVSNDEDGYELISRMKTLNIDYTAIVCANSIIQFKALQCLRDIGVNVPEDVSLIGGSVSEMTKISSPRLTAFHFDESEAARSAVKRLQEIIDGVTSIDNKTVTKVRFIEGQTASFCK